MMLYYEYGRSTSVKLIALTKYSMTYCMRMSGNVGKNVDFLDCT